MCNDAVVVRCAAVDTSCRVFSRETERIEIPRFGFIAKRATSVIDRLKNGQ